MVEPSQLSMAHGNEITARNGGNGGWDPAEKEVEECCPDKYRVMSQPKDGMIPALRAAYTPMSDTVLIPEDTSLEQQYSQGTGSVAFLKGSNCIYEAH